MKGQRYKRSTLLRGDASYECPYENGAERACRLLSLDLIENGIDTDALRMISEAISSAHVYQDRLTISKHNEFKIDLSVAPDGSPDDDGRAFRRASAVFRMIFEKNATVNQIEMSNLLVQMPNMFDRQAQKVTAQGLTQL